MTEHVFAFLTAHGLHRIEVENDIEGVQVRFRNTMVAIEIRLESESRLFVDVVPLTDGQLPRRFDQRGRELLTHFSLTRLLEEVDPEWRPPDLDNVGDRDDLLAALERLAEALGRHAGVILRVDRDLFARTEARMRRRVVLIMLENWARFVDRLRRGYQGSIAEYTTAITERGQLEGILQTWQGNEDKDPRAQLARLDEMFDDLTEPVPAMKSRDLFTLVPDPQAARWWRRPKVLTGPLREYFDARV